MPSNQKAKEQLGIAHGTANGRLRKMLLWKYVVDAGDNICFQCGQTIESIDDLSIDHKTPWLDSEDPISLFFDLGNIAFSHLSCNMRAARPHRKIDWPEGQAWCSLCKTMKPLDAFPKSKKHNRNRECRRCNTTSRRTQKRNRG